MERVWLDDFDGTAVRGAAARHAVKVLRARVGDVFAGYDGSRERILRVAGFDGGAVLADVVAERDLPETPGSRLTLAAALLKGRRWDLLLEKAAELGVGRIIPLAAERSVAKLSGEDSSERLERWRRILGGASAQCAGRAPEICEPENLASAVARLSGAPNKFILITRGAAESFATAVRELEDGETVVMVGPEGDWSDSESRAAADSGFRAAALGPLILRAETAAIAAAAIFSLAGKDV
ncbi:MAG TPA: RsmE family RNA methyltransferase [bacterium]|nr:RsmE family RNA methyltransferase [bacterium]